MKEYHKIKTVYNRDPENKYKTLLIGEFATPEFEYLANNEWIFTEKVDGTNIRVMFNGESITFGGKTARAQIPADLVNKLSERFLPQLSIFQNTFDCSEAGSVEVCFYGEGYGPKIQKGGKYREDQDFVLFDVKIGNWWLQRKDVEDIAENFLLDVVPIIGVGTLHEMVDITRGGFNSNWGNFTAEGIVARPSVELKARSGERIITKIKYKDFHV